MKILILHNSYQQRGGEDSVVEAESRLLLEAGHDVHVELVSNDSIIGLAAKVQTFVDTPYSLKRKQWMKSLLKRTNADVVHIHNFFPLLTSAVHEAATEQGIAVIQTLHNFRTICANALLMRDGKICEKCLAGNRNWALFHRCYRNSLPGSLALVRMQARAFKMQTWEKHTNKIIALTQFGKRKLLEGGLPESRLIVKPNFVHRGRSLGGEERKGALFVGRLSPEKGVIELIEAWKSTPGIPLRIIGDGPERARMESMAPKNVKFLGLCSRESVRMEMARAQMLVVPSICYEAFGLAVIEAFEVGTPVVASRFGAMEEIVVHGRNGLHFNPGDVVDLAKTVRSAFARPVSLVEMGISARKSYEMNYTPEKNLKMLEEIYASAIQDANNL